jgi:hypothetical protein
MIFLWIVMGIAVVTGAFFLPAPSMEIWPSLNAAGIAAAAYLLALILYTLRHPVPLKHRIIVGILSLISMGALFFHWTGMEGTTLWQQQRLLDIQSAVSRGVIRTESPQKLLSVLERYHQQGKNRKAALGQLFLLTFPGAAVGSDIHKRMDERDSVRLWVTTLTDSMIIVTGSHAYLPGRSAGFIPSWGRTGTIQERFILTAKGVSHESDN